MGELEKGSHLGRSIAQYAKIDECHFLVKKKEENQTISWPNGGSSSPMSILDQGQL